MITSDIGSPAYPASVGLQRITPWSISGRKNSAPNMPKLTIRPLSSAPASTRSRNSRSSSIGSGARSSTSTKAVSSTAAAAPQASTAGDVQPRPGPSIRP